MMYLCVEVCMKVFNEDSLSYPTLFFDNIITEFEIKYRDCLAINICNLLNTYHVMH